MDLLRYRRTAAAWTPLPPPAVAAALDRLCAERDRGGVGLVRMDLPPMGAVERLAIVLPGGDAAVCPGAVAGSGLRVYHATAQALGLVAGDRAWAEPLGPDGATSGS
jgi:hypothetical protein